jgi:hypothetical protein
MNSVPYQRRCLNHTHAHTHTPTTHTEKIYQRKQNHHELAQGRLRAKETPPQSHRVGFSNPRPTKPLRTVHTENSITKSKPATIHTFTHTYTHTHTSLSHTRTHTLIIHSHSILTLPRSLSTEYAPHAQSATAFHFLSSRDGPFASCADGFLDVAAASLSDMVC